jgi:hypothetical protein
MAMFQIQSDTVKYKDFGNYIIHLRIELTK